VSVTSQVARLDSAEAFVEVNGACKAMADPITTLAKQRRLRLLGTLSKVNFEAVARVVCVQLNLWRPLLRGSACSVLTRSTKPPYLIPPRAISANLLGMI